MKRIKSMMKEGMESKKPRNGDVTNGSTFIHINSIPYELLGVILNECEEYSFISQFICKHWKATYKYLIQPEWNKEIQKSEDRKERITWKEDKISLSFLQWVVDDVKGKNKLTYKSMNRAAYFGDLEMIKWLREQEAPWSEYTCAYAAKGGHLEVLKYLKEQDCPWNDEWTCSYAAKGGHLEVLKWLKEQKYIFTQLACSYAAKGGHLEILKWLREQGCPLGKYTCFWASHIKGSELSKWLKENKCYCNGTVH
jgi:hypothetical protein